MKRIPVSFFVLILICFSPFITPSTRAGMIDARSLTLNSVQDKSSINTIDLSLQGDPEVLHVTKNPLLTLADFAKAEVSSKGGKAILQVTLRDSGASRLMEFSKNNVGRKLAVLVDRQLVKAPLIRVPIAGKEFQVDAFDQTQASELARLINEHEVIR